MDPEQPVYLKCSCVHCAGHLEFERSYLGSRVQCPHCGQETALTFSISSVAPSAPAAGTPTPLAAAGSDARMPRYAGGDEVRTGDRVRYRETFARVVFVTDGERCEFSPGYEECRGQEAGIVICDDDGETTVLHEEDPNLEFVRR